MDEQTEETGPLYRLECGLCGSDWLDVPEHQVESARQQDTCLSCGAPMAPETWTVYPLHDEDEVTHG